MNYVVSYVGSGTADDKRRLGIDASVVESYTDNGDSTATVTLTREVLARVRGFSGTAATALNGGSAWGDIKAIRPEGVSLTLVKQDLVANVKKKWSEMDTVPQGFVVSHDSGTTRGLWRAQTDTTAEPTKDHADWSLVFEITV